MSDPRAMPLVGDIPLEAVQLIEHAQDGGFVSTRIAGLPGELQQRLARPSHRVRIAGVLFGSEALDDLGKLQKAAEEGAELTFAADITTALDLKKVVVTSFWTQAEAGVPDRYAYELVLTESPPLPPPAQVAPFGGLGDFGLGDLGFDTSILGDIADVAGKVAGAVEQAIAVVGTLQALAKLGDLNIGSGLLKPVEDAVGKVGKLGDAFKKAGGGLASVFGT
jgi:hypothetical protein